MSKWEWYLTRVIGQAAETLLWDRQSTLLYPMAIPKKIDEKMLSWMKAYNLPISIWNRYLAISGMRKSIRALM